MRCLNHPRVGSSTTVEPIQDIGAILRIKQLLAGHPRNLALFTVGINTAFRAGDLLGVVVGQVRGLAAGDELVVREHKTRNRRRVTLNSACVSAIDGLLRQRGDVCPDDLLFVGQRGALTVSYLNRLVKRWCAAVGLRGNYGSHTLRKTWGYHQRVTYGVSVVLLMEAYGHASQRQTMTYLGIQPDEIRGVYENVI